MTKEQEKHLEEIKKWATGALDLKYRRGQAEHGGNLWERPILPEIKAEVTDLITYVQTLEKKVDFVREGVQLIKTAFQRGKMADAQDILDIVDSKLRDL